MADPILYGPAYSTYVRTCRIALAEKGVPYKLVEVDMLKGECQTPDYLARQPFGKVPAFEHDGFALYETCAIARYVDEAFPGPKLQPADVRQRARMTQLVSISDSYCYGQMIGKVVWQRAVMPLLGGQTDEAVCKEGAGPSERAMAAVDKLIGANAFAAGDQVSLADFHLIPVFAYFSQMPEYQAAIGKYPQLARWWGTVQNRASVTATAPQLG